MKMSLMINLGDECVLEMLVIIHFENLFSASKAVKIMLYEALFLPLWFLWS
jgi:hypothetical protein